MIVNRKLFDDTNTLDLSLLKQYLCQYLKDNQWLHNFTLTEFQENIFNNYLKYIYPRKSIDKATSIVNVNDIKDHLELIRYYAKLIANVIGDEKLNNIQYQANKYNDPYALLLLGDCYMCSFKMKACNKDTIIACNYYYRAYQIAYNRPGLCSEALVAQSLLSYFQLFPLHQRNEILYDTIIPDNKYNTMAFQLIWNTLKLAAYYKYTCPFMIIHTYHAIHLPNHPYISKYLLDVYQEYECNYQVELHECHNPHCLNKYDKAQKNVQLLFCAQCKCVQYCSQECQLLMLNEHKEVRMPLQSNTCTHS